MKYLIVVPRFIDAPGQSYHFPIGLGYIASSLKHHGHQVDCLNLNHHHGPLDEVMGRRLSRGDIGAVLSGGLSAHYSKIKDLFDTVQRLSPGLVKIGGGGIVSSEPELMLRAFGLDFGVIGEGEATIGELADALEQGRSLNTVNGIAYADNNGQVIVTPPRPVSKNLEQIPWPDYEGLEIEAYLDDQTPADQFFYYPFDDPRVLPIINSRSCPFRCTFCYHPLGNQYRERPLDDFFAEVEFLVTKYRVNGLCILDELFANRRERVQEFCRHIKKFNLKWLVNLRVDGVDRELLQMMKAAGCYYVCYGVESASDTVLKSMKKKITRAQIDQALRDTAQTGLGIQANLIFGDPAETRETVQESLNWYTKHPEYQVNLAMISLYPGTELYRRAVERGLIKDRLEFIACGCPLTNVSQLTPDEYRELTQLVQTLPAKFLIAPRQAECRKTGVHPTKGDIFQLKVTCPFCKTEVEYRNLNRLVGYGRLCCKACNQRFWLPRDIFDQATARYQAVAQLSQMAQQGISAAQSGNLPEAQRIFQQITNAFPDVLDGHIYLAQVALNRGDLVAAQNALTNAVRLAPQNPAFHYNLGMVFLQRGQWDAGENSLKQCLALDPGNREASANLDQLLKYRRGLAVGEAMGVGGR